MSSKTWRRFATSAAVISVAIASAVVGGASTSQAATGFIVDLQPQVGTPSNTVSVVSRGAKIGYHLFIQNSGDSTTQHVTIVVRGVTATFLDADNPLCGPGPTTDKMVCTPTSATLAPGDTFNVNFRFVAPAAGDSVTTTAAITVSAQTVGGKKNGTNGTTLKESQPVSTILTGDDATQNTYLRGNGHCTPAGAICEKASTGNLSATHPQNFSFQTPASLFGAFAVAVAVHDEPGAPAAVCNGCLQWHTALTIPLAQSVSTTDPDYPFFDPLATTFYPYSWSMSAQYPSGFQLHGVVHNGDQVPACTSGGPTAAAPLCYDPATLLQISNKKRVEVKGFGLENGNWGFN